MEADFSGYATKSGILCADGRTITAGAFKHQDKQRVPLVWQHRHDEPINVLGHAILENRSDGVYAYGYFNDTDYGQHARKMVKNGDITALSIYANKLKQQGGSVLHGAIREVSLVLSGANPGAYIENVNLKHGDGYEVAEDEAVIYHGDEDIVVDIEDDADESNDESDTSDESTDESTNTDSDDAVAHAENNGGTAVADTKEKTVKDVFDSFTDEQKNVVYFMIGEAVADAEGKDKDDDKNEASHDDFDDEDEFLNHQEGSSMARNVFEGDASVASGPTLSHSQVSAIVDDAKRFGSLKEAFLAHAGEYGIDNIDILFPDAKAVANTPELLSRQMEWVSKVLGATKHSPFSKIKSLVADLTAEEARAKGYVKGNLKKEEVINLLKRTTGPATVYKKQKLDRDDIIDITDLDVVAFLKGEIRLMLNEELARAILIGDGRSAGSEDKIKDPAGSNDGVGIRSIANDHDMYNEKVTLPTNVTAEAAVEAITRARTKYRGSGSPTLYTTDSFLTDMLLLKDKMGRRLYDTEAALASVLRVKEIVAVEVLEETTDVLGIIVNLADYTIGANKGGELSFFEDFDIDYNQNKYLLETRVSGALTKLKSAITIKRAVGEAVTPASPSFDGPSNTITIPTTTGVVYLINDEVVTGDVVIEESTTVSAQADEGYHFPNNTTTEWTFTYTGE